MTGTRASEVRKHERDDHTEGVLDRPEPQRTDLHGAPHVVHGRTGQRTEEEIQRQSEQDLQIEQNGENERHRVLAGHPGTPREGKSPQRCRNPRQQHRPSQPGMHVENRRIHGVDDNSLELPAGCGVH